MSFASVDKEYQAEDDSVLDGPMLALWRGGAGEPRQLVEGGLLERLLDRMRPFISNRGDELQDGVRLDTSEKYPAEAVREAVLNALVHRDWTRALEVEVVNYADRLEVTSPGSLQNVMTVEKMLAGQRSARNPIIVEVMRDYGYVDQRGMGVRRKIVPLVRAFSGRNASFEATDDFLRVTLPARLGRPAA